MDIPKRSIAASQSTHSLRRLLGVIEELTQDLPPDNWKPHDEYGEPVGYGDSVGQPGYVPGVDITNMDDVHSHGTVVGCWRVAVVLRRALDRFEGK